jgi:hypothetical protein
MLRKNSQHDPLVQAASHLETRIYNIVELDFFGRFFGTDSTDPQEEYAARKPEQRRRGPAASFARGSPWVWR